MSCQDRYTEILNKYWGYTELRGIQREIIESIGSGRDTLGLMPTGGGKSITFQVPALAMKGVCIVVTPLVALMKDQVANLRKRHIRAAALHSGLSHEELLTVLDNCVFGFYRFLYVSPERLSSELFAAKLKHMEVSFITVDEAHCISQWGHDFRPSYLQIAELRKLVPAAPVLALTATATPEVAKDIQRILCFRQENEFRMSFHRENLAYQVLHADYSIESLRRVLQAEEGSCIIYRRSRQQCEDLAGKLNAWGFTATFFHAGLSHPEKDKRQKQWVSDEVRIMVATSAFGMGIDKADVRLVVHLDIPDSIEEYFQEAGRAGRDGKPARSIIILDGRELEYSKRRPAQRYPAENYIRDAYEDVCCYFQVAVGDGYHMTREFNVGQFCRFFHYHPFMLHSALSILDNAGYIAYRDAEDGQRVCNCQRKPFWYQHMLQGGNAGFGRICQGKGPGRLQHPAAHGGAFSFGDMLPDRQRRQHQQRQAAAHGAAENHAPAGPPRIAARPEVQTDQGDGHGKELLRNLHDG